MPGKVAGRLLAGRSSDGRLSGRFSSGLVLPGRVLGRFISGLLLPGRESGRVDGAWTEGFWTEGFWTDGRSAGLAAGFATGLGAGRATGFGCGLGWGRSILEPVIGLRCAGALLRLGDDPPEPPPPRFTSRAMDGGAMKKIPNKAERKMVSDFMVVFDWEFIRRLHPELGGRYAAMCRVVFRHPRHGWWRPR